MELDVVDWNGLSADQFRQLERKYQDRRRELSKERRRSVRRVKSDDKDNDSDTKVVSVDGVCYVIPLTVYLDLKLGIISRDDIVSNYLPVVDSI